MTTLKEILEAVALNGRKGTKGGVNRRVIIQAEGDILALMGEKNELATEFCFRVKAWCKKNGVEYMGDYLISPVFENMFDDILKRMGA